MILKLIFILNVAFAALTTNDEVGYGDGRNSDRSGPLYQECAKKDSFIALNRSMSIDGVSYKHGTEIYFDDEGKGFIYPTDSEEIIPVSLKNNEVNCKHVTVIPYNSETGELGEYNIPIDFELAGRTQKPKKRGGTTYCYRGVKNVVNGNKNYARGKLKLSGSAAYMAHPQLERSGLKKFKDYKSAPNGAICVFGKGGKKTSSGGHKYGHIGIKGRGGVINPASGFALKRPFLGCYGPKSK